jgi:hypothetical protein
MSTCTTKIHTHLYAYSKIKYTIHTILQLRTFLTLHTTHYTLHTTHYTLHTSLDVTLSCCSLSELVVVFLQIVRGELHGGPARVKEEHEQLCDGERG